MGLVIELNELAELSILNSTKGYSMKIKNLKFKIYISEISAWCIFYIIACKLWR